MLPSTFMFWPSLQLDVKRFKRFKLNQVSLHLENSVKPRAYSFPKLDSKITFDFTISLQNTPFYEMKLNSSPFKCIWSQGDWTSIGHSKDRNQKDTTQIETAVWSNLFTLFACSSKSVVIQTKFYIQNL